MRAVPSATAPRMDPLARVGHHAGRQCRGRTPGAKFVEFRNLTNGVKRCHRHIQAQLYAEEFFRGRVLTRKKCQRQRGAETRKSEHSVWNSQGMRGL